MPDCYARRCCDYPLEVLVVPVLQLDQEWERQCPIPGHLLELDLRHRSFASPAAMQRYFRSWGQTGSAWGTLDTARMTQRRLFGPPIIASREQQDSCSFDHLVGAAEQHRVMAPTLRRGGRRLADRRSSKFSQRVENRAQISGRLVILRILLEFGKLMPCKSIGALPSGRWRPALHPFLEILDCR